MGASMRAAAAETLAARDEMTNRQVADMRALLRLMSNASAAESLKVLRAAFPDATLAARSAAVAGGRFQA
jgi:hypothetical protein